jgi:hypothetical protein
MFAVGKYSRIFIQQLSDAWQIYQQFPGIRNFFQKNRKKFLNLQKRRQ